MDFQPQRYGRRAHPDAGVEAAIEAGWAALVEEAARTDSSLYNASKFRFAGCAVERRQQGQDQDDVLVLCLALGLTDYKTFKRTDAAEPGLVGRLQADGERIYGDPAAFLSQKLGVSSVVVTADGHVVLIRRSLRGVAVFAGMLDTPGGHPEPAHVPGAEDSSSSSSSSSSSTGQDLAARVRAEVFDSALAEVHDEINIPREALGAPLLLGLVRQLTCGGSPSAAVLVSCALSAADIRSCYATGGKEAAESTELLMVDRAHLASFLRESGARLTPAAEGALTLYQRHLMKK